MFARWMGFGALLPFARGHTGKGNVDKEPWSFGAAVERTCRQALQRRYPKAADLLVEAEADILAYMAFPQSHWRRIYSTNPLERLNKEVKRRTNVVGVFPDRDSVIRLVGSLLMEVDDEWQIGRRYFSQASMKELLEPEPLADAKALPMPVLPIH